VITPSPVMEDQALIRKRPSPLRWVISILGLILSCMTTMYSGIGLYSGLANRQVSPTDEGVNRQTQIAISLTQVASSGQQAVTPQELSPLKTQPATVPTPQSADSGLALTGLQRKDDFSFFDDFSSPALGWASYNNGVTTLQYEDQAYSFQLKDPGRFDLAYWPVDFIPYEISFDAWSLEGQQDGTFGVFCQYQDVENYYYVEIDLLTKEYTIAQSLNSEYIPLTAKNASGKYWQSTNALKLSPTAVNRISVSCYLDTIMLSINDQLVDNVSISQPFSDPGTGAFFVYTFKFAGEDGYKVYFDNV